MVSNVVTFYVYFFKKNSVLTERHLPYDSHPTTPPYRRNNTVLVCTCSVVPLVGARVLAPLASHRVVPVLVGHDDVRLGVQVLKFPSRGGG